MAVSTRVIVIGMDLSEQAEQAFRWYLKTIHKPENRVVFVHVSEMADCDGNKVSSEDAAKLARNKELEDRYNIMILENGMSGNIRTEGGSKPGDVICRVAEEERAELVVMGTRGLGRLHRTLVGSVSDYVVHHAPCPVLIYRPSGEQLSNSK